MPILEIIQYAMHNDKNIYDQPITIQVEQAPPPKYHGASTPAKIPWDEHPGQNKNAPLFNVILIVKLSLQFTHIIQTTLIHQCIHTANRKRYVNVDVLLAQRRRR